MTKQEKEALKAEEAENKKQFELAEKERVEKSEREKESKDSDTIVAEKEEKPKKQKNDVVQEGVTNGAGSFIPYENGKLPDAYKEQTKDWKPYKRFSDGSIKF